MENPNTKEKIRILYLDDEEFNLHAFKATFRYTYQVFVTSNAAEALKTIGEQNIQIVVSDQRMPEVTGVEFLKMVVEKYPNTKRILLTGYSDQNDTVNAINIGKISKFVNKPWEETKLNAIFQELYAQYLEEIETKEKADKLENVAKERDLYKEESNQIEFMLRQKLLED
jgi:response regulator RpfG family c-di-GMP phosphodiesterase